jgi:hypothetical protein
MTPRPRRGAPSANKARLAGMIEEATVDCYGEAEQATGWLCALEEPGAAIQDGGAGRHGDLSEIELRDDNAIVAWCWRARTRQAILLADLPLPSPGPEGAEWVDAYRHFLGRR